MSVGVIPKTTTDIHLDKQYDNDIIISKNKCLCGRLLICLNSIRLNVGFLFSHFIMSILYFIIMWLLLFSIFCRKDESKSCLICNIVSMGLSIIIDILINNYFFKLEKENKIDSEILKWILWFTISFGFATLFIFTPLKFYTFTDLKRRLFYNKTI